MRHFVHFIKSQRHSSWLTAVGVGVLTGALHGLSWPLFHITALNAVFLLPYLLFIPRARRLKDVVVMAMTYSLTSCWLGFYWLAYMAESFGDIPHLLSPLVVFLFSLIGQSHNLIIAVVLYGAYQGKFGKRLSKPPVLSIPALYVAIDYLYPKLFCDTQGASLYQWHELIQVVEYTGVYGLTFLVVWWNAALACAVAPLLFHTTEDAREVKRRQRRAFLYLGVIAVLFVALHFWGAERIDSLEAEQAAYPRKLTVSVIQANIGDADKLASEQGSVRALKFVLDTYEALTRQAVALEKPDLVVWPETAYPYLYTHFTNVRANRSGESHDQWLIDFVASIRTPLYFGGYSTDGKLDYNSAWLVQGRYEPAGLYQKNILLAFGESVPLGPLSPYVREAFPAVGNFGRGPGPTNLAFKGYRIGPLICYETLDLSYVRDTVAQGADFLLNLTNDSWFGPTSAPYSHLLLSVFRAIETRRPLLRATNTGVTALIDQMGRIQKPTALFKPVIYTAEIHMPRAEDAITTFFVRWGRWFETLCILFCLGLGVYSLGAGKILPLKFRK